MKLIVTHFSPDLDALTSCWLIKRFLPGWKKAEIKFVPAGSTFNNQPADLDKDIIHVDTGMGKFDHHQTSSYTCATKKVFSFLKNEGFVSKKILIPLTRMVEIVNQIDHFKEVNFLDPTADIYDFCLHQMIEGGKIIFETDDKLINHFLICLDAIFQIFKNKVKAEEEIKNGLIFFSKWGKSLAIQSKNEETAKLALKMGYVLVVRKDPQKGFVRIKAQPEKNIDLTKLYQSVKNLDKKGSWFLHVSKTMLLNGSSKNPNLLPTSLTLPKIIAIIKNL